MLNLFVETYSENRATNDKEVEGIKTYLVFIASTLYFNSFVTSWVFCR